MCGYGDGMLSQASCLCGCSVQGSPVRSLRSQPAVVIHHIPAVYRDYCVETGVEFQSDVEFVALVKVHRFPAVPVGVLNHFDKVRLLLLLRGIECLSCRTVAEGKDRGTS